MPGYCATARYSGSAGLFPQEDGQPEEADVQEMPYESQFMSLSAAAMTGIVQPLTMCFWGTVGDQNVRILLDSGSTHTFVSKEIAARCAGIQPLAVPLSVRVANGQLLHCSYQIPQAVWSIQNCQFISDLKVLQLSNYDMILGLDWLAAHSPMETHWGQKWIQFQHEGRVVQLVSILPKLCELSCSYVQLRILLKLISPHGPLKFMS